MISRLNRSLVGLSKMAFSTKSFTSLEQMNKYLEQKRASYTLVYFRSSWNPHCAEADKHVDMLAHHAREFDVIKINSDEAPKIARHYSVRSEPQFVFCLYGDEVVRQIGPNLQALKNKVKKVQKLASQVNLQELDLKWVPYGTQFEAYHTTILDPVRRWNR